MELVRQSVAGPTSTPTPARDRSSRTQRTVVFVHGAANDHSVWAWQSRYFAHHGFNVLAVDLPGHGRSGGRRAGLRRGDRGLDSSRCSTRRMSSAPRSSDIRWARSPRSRRRRGIRARVDRIALLGPAVPMTVSDELLDAARPQRPPRVRAHQRLVVQRRAGSSAAMRCPGMWMTGNAMRLMERTRPGVLVDRPRGVPRATRTGSPPPPRCAVPCSSITGGRDIMAPPTQRAGADRGAARSRRSSTLPEQRARADGRGARRGARCAARVL